MRRFRLPVVVFASALLTASLGHGLSYVLVRDHHLARQADLIVRGEILGSSPNSKIAAIDYGLEIHEVVKGDFAAETLQFRVLGGFDPGGETYLEIYGTPDFAAGQRVLLFLSRMPDGELEILHFHQGAFWETTRSAERLYYRPLPEEYDTVLHDTGREEGLENLEIARQGRGFLAYLRDGSFPEVATPEYLTVIPEAEPGVAISEFTLIVGKASPAPRWTFWDTGSGTLKWKLQKKKIKKGKAAAKKAAPAWNKKSKAGNKMKVAGSTGSKAGLDSSDGINSINLKDLNGRMPKFNCAVGGTLGLGGPWWRTSPTHMWKGRPYFQAIEGDVVLANGITCFGANLAKVLQAVLVHEIGHAIAFGHACGDSKSPNCSTSTVLAGAKMAAKLNMANLGTKLGQDDKDASQYLYGQGDKVTCNLPPGHKNFCKKCGPCGTGQGSCGGNKQCQTGLTCKKKAGGDFGLDPKTAVCK